MLILQIRQAESALADGRLDEAFELASTEDVRAHRRGQQLIGRLARAFIDRGREHLEAQRMQQALTDCEKAGKLGGNLPECAELKSAIAKAMSVDQQQNRQKADAAAAAREHIENGRLSIGEQLLTGLDGESGRAVRLRGEAAARRATVESALEQARNALRNENWDTAIDALLQVKHTHTSNKQLAELTAQLTNTVTERIQSAIDQGRLDLAETLLKRLAPLAGETIETQELSRILRQCRQASGELEQGQLRRASEIVRRLVATRPEAAWLKEALNNTLQAAENIEQLRGGPLGLFSSAPGQVSDNHQEETHHYQAESPTPPAMHTVVVGPPLPTRFTLHVDGVGSFLVLRDREMTIGPAGSSGHADVGLLAESGLPTISIEREEEDYLLHSSEPVRVNNTPVTRKLLANGDRINLSPRCGMKFTVPNAASTSAMLTLSGTRLPHSDARRIILLGGEIILGPGRSAHIRADKLAEKTILQVRDNRLFCRCNMEVTINNRPMTRTESIPLNTPARIGPICFVVTT